MIPRNIIIECGKRLQASRSITYIVPSSSLCIPSLKTPGCDLAPLPSKLLSVTLVLLALWYGSRQANREHSKKNQSQNDNFLCSTVLISFLCLLSKSWSKTTNTFNTFSDFRNTDSGPYTDDYYTGVEFAFTEERVAKTVYDISTFTHWGWRSIAVYGKTLYHWSSHESKFFASHIQDVFTIRPL